MKNLLIILTILLTVSNVYSYQEKIHLTTTEYAVTSSNLSNYLSTNLSISLNSKLMDEFLSKKTAVDWIKTGGVKEDDLFPALRVFNHFYDPTTEKGIRILLQQNSSKEWAKDRIGNDWSWASARTYFYESLTSPDSYIRETRLAATFRAVGQVMHLVEDLATPAHVRNDIHMPVNSDRDFYEDYTQRNFQPTEGYTIYSGYGPVDLTAFSNFDTFWKNNGKGLAEFTNKNFLSRDTNIDDNAYTLPVEIGESIVTETPEPNKEPVKVKYLQGYVTDSYRPDKSAPINKLAAFSYFDFEMKKRYIDKEVYTLNDGVHREYAKFLVPRAVGYAAGVLNYFFRGKLKLEPKPGGVSSTSITLTATNATPNEDLANGEVKLVVRYRHVIDPDDPNMIQNSDYQYKVYTYPGCTDASGNKICTLPAGAGADFTFDLSADPLPDWANDVSAQLVFRGRLGNETGAVAVGFVPLKVEMENLIISLPASGAYASTAGLDGFKRIELNAMTRKEGGLNESDGVLELKVMFRVANNDPFQGAVVTTTPTDDPKKPNGPYSYYVVTAAAPGVAKLEQNVVTPLTFTLPQTLPLRASDVYLYLVYRHSTARSAQALAVGFQDISEPTPIDVYNNTDKVCLSGSWYNAGSTEAMAIADTNKDGYADLTDIFKHDISNIYYQPGGGLASSSNYLFSFAGPLHPGSGKRLGYILTDYTFSQSLSESVTSLDSRDTWNLNYDDAPLAADGYVNQKRGIRQGYSGMYDMRGFKMHGGAGIVWDNQEYPDGSKCSWDLLRLPTSP